MKKITTILCLAIVALAFTFFSCGSGATPERVAQKYVESFINQDFKTMKSLAVGTELDEIDEYELMLKEQMPAEKQAMLDELKKYNCVAQPAEIDPENPTFVNVIVKQTDPEGKEMDWKIELEKVDGKWKVSNLKIK